MEALYNKYRPHTFSELTGQDHIKLILEQAEKEKNFAHAYLLVGPRGTGKTTVARIIARALGAQDIDLLEIDAASNTGVDAMRDLIDKAQFSPSLSPCKVYIVDEVHMLSKSAFNALLKTLEEPPAHVYFILATTEIQKVPLTIVSRCQRLDFHRILPAAIEQRLAFIAESEKIDFEPEALKQIAEVSDGGLRDAVTLLQQVIFDGKITLEGVNKTLGLLRKDHLEKMLKLLLAGNADEAVALVRSLYAEGLSVSQLVRQLLEYIRDGIFQNTHDRQQLFALADKLLELDVRGSVNPLFELELVIYGVNGEQRTVPSKGGFNSEIQNSQQPSKNNPPPSSNLQSSTTTVTKEQMDAIASLFLTSKVRLSFKACTFKSIEGNTIHFEISSKFHFETLNQLEVKQELEKYVAQVLGKNYGVVFDLVEKVEAKKPMNSELLSHAKKLFSED